MHDDIKKNMYDCFSLMVWGHFTLQTKYKMLLKPLFIKANMCLPRLLLSVLTCILRIFGYKKMLGVMHDERLT